MIRRFMLGGVMLLGLSVPLCWVACDRTLEEHTKVTNTDGEKKVEKKSIVEHPDGSITKEQEKTVTEDH
jgi:hypothetical protein